MNLSNYYIISLLFLSFSLFTMDRQDDSSPTISPIVAAARKRNNEVRKTKSAEKTKNRATSPRPIPRSSSTGAADARDKDRYTHVNEEQYNQMNPSPTERLKKQLSEKYLKKIQPTADQGHANSSSSTEAEKQDEAEQTERTE